MPIITFLPMDKSITVPRGTSVLAAIREAGISFSAPCGGKGSCGKCVMEEVAGLAPETKAEEDALNSHQLGKPMRLACQARICHDAVVRLPVPAFSDERKTLLHRNISFHIDPRFTRERIRLEKATVLEPSSLVSRIRESLKREGKTWINIDLKHLRQIAMTPMENVAGLFLDHDLVDLYQDGCEKKVYGLALDIGTTTMVMYLLDLDSGRQLAVSALANPQASFGADVLSRISSMRRNPDNLTLLHTVLIEGINRLITNVTALAGIPQDAIYDLVAVGNTCMTHFFLGVSPASLAVAPYHAIQEQPVEVPAADLKIAMNKNGLVRTLPGIRSFVGADTVGAILAAELHKSPKTVLLIDIGTNGEIVLKTPAGMAACSTAAGPAFEGATILHGMRADMGAIEGVSISENKGIEIKTIGNGKAKGICGSGLIDAVFVFRQLGLMDATGKIIPVEQAPGVLAHRIIPWKKGRAIILAAKEETDTGKEMIITQQDIRQIQLTKGAIQAGIAVLMMELGVEKEELDEIILAGAFGSYISRVSARGIGLIPPVELEKIVSFGNAAGEGAKKTLLSKREYQESLALAQKVKYIPLSAHKSFNHLFLKGMHFPVLDC